MHLKISLAALLATALIAAGCGGDDETTSSTSTTAESTGASGASGASGETGQAPGGGLLPDDFAADADAICEAGNVELDAAFAKLGQNPSNADVDKVVKDTVTPSIQGQIDDIRDLGEPEEGAEEFNTFLDDAQAELDELEADPSSIQGNAFADVNKQAIELGLPACAG